MWTLRKTSSEAKYFLPCNKKTVIGRKDVDIVISGDSSVSRKHSSLSIQHEAVNIKHVDRIPTVVMTDSSKFGTFILRPDNEKLKVNNQMAVRSGDIIQFGAQTSLYELKYEPFVVAMSIPDNQDLKIKLQQTMLQLGGHLVSNWHDKVTHVVTEKIKLSVKITQALVNCCHIVTPEYLFKLKEILGKCSENVVEPEKYIPEVGEPNLRKEFCSFNVNKNRKVIFEKRIFIFLCKKQLKRLGPSITGGDGITKIWSLDEHSSDPNQQKRVFVDFNPNNKDSVVTDSQHQAIHSNLAKHKQRFIQEHEIGLAILYCDTSVYCNPSFDLDSQVALSQCYDSHAAAEQELSETSKIPTIHATSVKNEQITIDEAADCVAQEVQDTITDSCLEDDSLWSQNYEPAAEVQHKTMSAKTNFNNIKKTSLQNTSNSATVMDGHPKVIDAGHLNDDFQQNIPNLSAGSERHSPVVDALPSIKLEGNSACFPTSEPVAKMSKKTDSTSCGSNKYLEHNFAHDLPTNVAVVGIEPLIKKKRKRPNSSNFTDCNIKNFKHFRKVWPTYMGANEHTSSMTPSHVPHIIGSSDLFVNVDDSDQMNVMGKWLNQPSADPGLFT